MDNKILISECKKNRFIIGIAAGATDLKERYASHLSSQPADTPPNSPSANPVFAYVYSFALVDPTSILYNTKRCQILVVLFF